MFKIRFVGLDVHADTIAVAIAEPEGGVRSVGVIPNRMESIRKLAGKLGPVQHLKVCYEAGPTGYVLYWQLTALGVACEVVAPTLVPTKAGDRVKTDRRDAEKLARCYRAGELTAVWVPDDAHEALRDLVRAREAAKKINSARATGWVNFCSGMASVLRKPERHGPRSIWKGLRRRCVSISPRWRPRWRITSRKSNTPPSRFSSWRKPSMRPLRRPARRSAR
jgi:hypothetical protein